MHMKKILLIVITSTVAITLNAQVLVSDSLALVDVFKAANSTQDYTKPINTWSGVTLSQRGNRVIRLSIIANGSNPTLSPSIKNLNMLQYLTAAQFTGNIPDLTGLTSLTYLDLSLGGKLTGVIPASISTLTAIQTLQLSYNQLSGNIPDLTGMVNLTDLNLSNNLLSGKIPNSIATLGKLVTLNLSNNNLSDTIPDLSKLSNLRNLWLNNNQLTGGFPNLDTRNYINTVNLANNQLSGSINGGTIFNLYVSNNNFSGSISIIYNSYSDITNNQFNFTSISGRYLGSNSRFSYTPQQFFNLVRNGDNLIASNAGGTEVRRYNPQTGLTESDTSYTDNTYTWYKDDAVVATITGNDTFNMTAPGRYYVDVTNSQVAGLTMSSNEILISTLPVSFGDFSAFITGNNLTVNWNTISEINNKEFIIEISKDGISNWQKVATISSKANGGNSITGIDYSTSIPLGSLALAALPFLLMGFVANKKNKITLLGMALLMSLGIYSCTKDTLFKGDTNTEKVFVKLSQVDNNGTTKVLGIKEAVRK